MNILQYIKGLRNGKNAHRIEYEAMRDPFLQDALDGYDSVKGNHEKEISGLQEKIKQRTKSNTRNLRIWMTAASVLIVLGIGIYVFVPADEEVYLTQDLQEDRIPPSYPEQETLKDPYSSPASELSEEETRQMPSRQKKAEDMKMVAPAPVEADIIRIEEAIPPPPVLSEEVDIAEMIADEEDKFREALTEETPSYYVFEKGTENSISVKDAERMQRSISVSKTEAPALSGLAASPATIPLVRGKVVDPQGEPVIGAIVSQKGTNNGSVTDVEGNFTLPADPSGQDILTISYLGYKTEEAKIKKESPMLIAMHEDAHLLEESVVIGYGTSKKSQVTSKPEPTMGKKEFRDYLRKNTKQPVDDACATAKGTVVLTFYINSNGLPENIQVKRSVCPSADQHAIDLLLQSGIWHPVNVSGEAEINFPGR